MFKSNLMPLVLSVVIAMFILLSGKSLPPKLPLFYSLPWGENQLVNREQLLVIPASVILITLLNLIISWQLHNSQTFFKKILLFSSLLINLLLTVAFLKIVLIFI